MRVNDTALEFKTLIKGDRQQSEIKTDLNLVNQTDLNLVNKYHK